MSHIDKGSYGESILLINLIVIKVKNTVDDKIYAMKVESNTMSFPQIEYEGNILKKLDFVGFPKLIDMGTDQNYNFIVFIIYFQVEELLGENLSEYLKKQNGRFTLKTVLLLADQMIDRIEKLHQCGFIHRDLKPEVYTI